MTHAPRGSIETRLLLTALIALAVVALAPGATMLAPGAGLAATIQQPAGSVNLMKNYHRESGVWESTPAPSPNPLAVQQTTGARCDASSERNGWWSLCKGSKVFWGDSFRLETNSRVRLKLRLGIIVLLPEVRDREGGRVHGEDDDIGLYSLEMKADTAIVHMERGVIIAKRWRGSQGAAFRMTASGMNANVTGTSWMLAVGADSVAELIVDVDEPAGKIILTRLGEGARAGSVDTIPAFAGRKYQWKNGQLLPGGVVPFDTPTRQRWSDVIQYNAEDVWDDGGFPWIIVPVAAVPVVLCVIFCNDIFGENGGKTGTVTIPVP